VGSIKTPNAALLAALMLLVAVIFVSTAHTSVGLPLRIGRMVPCYPGERRVVVIRVFAHGGIKIDIDESDKNRLGRDLDNIFRTRAVHAAYVAADLDVPFSKVVAVLDIASQHLDHIALLPASPVLAREPHQGETETCVDMTFTERDARKSDRQSSVWH
jgi:biopolymer transport protein ExbD